MTLAWLEIGLGNILYLWDKRNFEDPPEGSSRTECKFCIVSSPTHGGSELGVMHQELVHSCVRLEGDRAFPQSPLWEMLESPGKVACA